MKKPKQMNFIVDLQVYPFDVMCSFGQTDDQLKKSLARYGVDWEENMKIKGKGLFYINDKNQSMIRLRQFPENNEWLGYLHHEIFHAVTFIMDRVGMKLMLETSCESYAYLTQFLTVEIYKRITK